MIGFSLLGNLVAKWDPVPKNLENGTPETKKPYSIFMEHRYFFSVYFSLIFCIGRRRLSRDFGGQRSQMKALLNTFPDILQQSWKGETYGFVPTKQQFSLFLGLGFKHIGQFFQLVLQTGSV